MRGKNRCYVCFKKHEKGIYTFPDDMPYKFRWCCNCRSLSRVIVIIGLKKKIKFFKKYLGRIERISYIRKAKKLNKLIRLT